MGFDLYHTRFGSSHNSKDLHDLLGQIPSSPEGSAVTNWDRQVPVKLSKGMSSGKIAPTTIEADPARYPTNHTGAKSFPTATLIGNDAQYPTKTAELW
ncbi:hypothetical protein F443_20521 [Phytophthora nicotianae P1569]|uniref:Uncharacterized protein n=1 Tax=Phytophthora nicotianae P1569 TaxID=1317065 RepID=V9E0V4_PHYNI|nr:hypothetical protein F443_20521 [Phytophthora nicotianae P1569]